MTPQEAKQCIETGDILRDDCDLYYKVLGKFDNFIVVEEYPNAGNTAGEVITYETIANEGWVRGLELKRWKATTGDRVYYVRPDFTISWLYYLGGNPQTADGISLDELHAVGNYFKSYPEAEEASRRMKKAMARYHEQMLETGIPKLY
jgi:hypothetical protein